MEKLKQKKKKWGKKGKIKIISLITYENEKH